MWAAETISLTPKRAPRSSDAPGGYSGRRVNHRPLAHIERPPGSGGVTVGAGLSCSAINSAPSTACGNTPITGHPSTATFTPANLINRTELPVLTKATLMENFDQLDTRSNLRLTDVVDYLSRLAGTSCSSSAYYVSATGGTTGRRGVFLRTFAEWMQVVGSYYRAFN